MAATVAGGKSAFITVGTTCFDALIVHVVSREILELLQSKGFSRVLLQIGRGEFEPDKILSNSTLDLSWYRYKDSIADDIANADLVISHAGAGSILECLAAKRHLVVVINDTLMDNHQIELAAQVAKDGHLLYTTCGKLKETLSNMDLPTLKPFPPGKPELFAKFMDSVLGFNTEENR